MENRFNKEAHSLRANLRVTKHLVLLTNMIVILLLIWQVISSFALHQQYQASLMDKITDRTLDDYQEYFVTLRLKLDLFQQQHGKALSELDILGPSSSVDSYMPLLNKLREDVQHSRLFAFVDEKGVGSLRHITGDFLPQCQLEIASTILDGGQEKLLLHHSAKSIHFDLLQPLTVSGAKSKYLFVSFDTNVLQDILSRYQLPHQQLFLLRTDNLGKIELSTQGEQKPQQEMVMSTTELATFNFLKPIPNTRWQLAIRLDENYNNTILYQSVAKAITLWFILSVCMYGFYRLQKSRTKKYLSVAKEAIYSDEYDKLTALVNRTQFEKQLAEFIYQRKGQKHNGVVFQIDIDQFQLFNSSYGYTFGDALLADLSSRLTEYFSEEVVISRLGNDEFAVFAKQMEHDKAERYAENLRQFIQELPLQPLGRQVHVTACIGVVILDDEQVDSKRVLLSLGQAVAIAKSDGRNRIQLYQSEEGRLLKHAEEMRIIQSIELALRNDKFVLYRQKIASLNPSSNSHHYEVLLRMVGPDNTLISPRQIISIAEKYDLVHMIDLWVIEKTCQCILDEGHRGKYSINLSGKTLANDALTDSVTNIINRYGINPEQLAFEITETAAIGNLTSALGFIEAMRNKGHQFYLDDFGSGLSSFTYLQQLPVDVIKIDGSFVMSLFDDPVSKVLVENIHRIAFAMNKQTIAECVESVEAATALQELGIDFAQGHFFHHPEVWYQV